MRLIEERRLFIYVWFRDACKKLPSNLVTLNNNTSLTIPI